MREKDYFQEICSDLDNIAIKCAKRLAFYENDDSKKGRKWKALYEILLDYIKRYKRCISELR